MHKILIIEDDPSFSNSTAEILRLSEYEVQVAVDGRTGIKKAIDTLPDLILCDIQLPELDGFGVLKAIRNSEKLNRTLFVFMSGVNHNQDFRKGMDAGADDFLMKPFTGTELLMVVSSRLQRFQHLVVEFLPNFNNTLTLEGLSDRLTHRYPSSHFKMNAQLFHLGQSIHFLIFVVGGIVRCSRFDHSGKELTTAIYSPGQIIGLVDWLSYLPFQDDGHALTDLVTISIPVAEFKSEFNSTGALNGVLGRQLATEIKNRNELLLNLAYQDLRGKVAHAFIRLHSVMQTTSNPNPALPITRVTLATIAGIAKESAVRTVLDFIQEGLLEETEDGFRVLNRPGLAQIAQ